MRGTCDVGMARIQQLFRSGDVDQALALGGVLSTATDFGLLAYLGGVLIVTGRDWSLGFDLIARARAARAERFHRPERSHWLCVAAGFCEAMPRGDFPQAERWLAPGEGEGGAVPLQLGMNRSAVLALAGDPRRSLHQIEASWESATNAASPFYAQGLEVTRAICHLSLGNVVRARQSLAALPADQTSPQLLPWRHRVELLHSLHGGDLAAAECARRRMAQALEPFATGLYMPECRLAESLLLLHRKEHVEAIALLENLVAFCRRTSLRFWEMRAHQLLARCFLDRGWGFTGPLRRHLGQALRLSRRGGYDAVWRHDPLGVSAGLLAEAIRLDLDEEYTSRLLSQQMARSPVTVCRNVPIVALHAFGGPRVVKDGVPVSIRSHRVTQLLAWVLARVLARSDQPASAADLIEFLWPDHFARQGQNNLARLLFDLRRTVWPECRNAKFLIFHDAGSIRLDPAVSTDLDQYSRLLAQADGLCANGHLDQAVPLYERLLALSGEPFLEAYPDEGLPGQAAGFEADRHRIVGLLASHALARGRPAQAERWCRRQMERDPWDEATLQMLLRSLAAQGRRACAVRTLRDYRCRLQHDLALDLSPDTLKAADSLIRAAAARAGGGGFLTITGAMTHFGVPG